MDPLEPIIVSVAKNMTQKVINYQILERANEWVDLHSHPLIKSANRWLDDHGHYLLNNFVPGFTIWPLVLISAIYTMLVVVVLPWFMRDREPYPIERLIKWYNIVNISANTVGFLMTLYISNMTYELWRCGGDSYYMFFFGTAYLALKIFDLLDTVFFVLRKKQSHVTFLHVWHHASMPLCTWIGLKFYPRIPIAWTGLLNTFVHIVMYVYYYMAADPTLKRYLWWKRYITVLQMTQFVLIFIHWIAIYLKGCDVPVVVCTIGMAQALAMFYLFGQFYLKTYARNSSKKHIE